MEGKRVELSYHNALDTLSKAQLKGISKGCAGETIRT